MGISLEIHVYFLRHGVKLAISTNSRTLVSILHRLHRAFPSHYAKFGRVSCVCFVSFLTNCFVCWGMRKVVCSGALTLLYILKPIAGFVPYVSKNGLSTHRVQDNELLGRMNAMEASSNCGCEIQFSGKPSDRAKSSNPREIVRNSLSEIYSITGEKIRLDDLLEEHPVNIVVFLRSFG